MMIHARLLFQPVPKTFWAVFVIIKFPAEIDLGFLFVQYISHLSWDRACWGTAGCLASLGMLGWIQLTAEFPGNCVSLMPWFDSFSVLINLGNSAILTLILYITSWYDSSCDLVRWLFQFCIVKP